MVTHELHERVLFMSKDIPSKKYKGVYYRDLKSGDRSYFIITRIAGKQKRISVGKKSEGITEAFCYQQKVKIINAEKFGEGTAEILQRKNKQDPTFRELFDYWMEHSVHKENSKRVAKYLINQVPFANERKITRNHIIKFQRDMQQERSSNTVDNKINMLSSVFNLAIADGKYRFENPCANVPRTNANDKRDRYLTKAEVSALLAATRDNDLLYLFTKLALCTGARIGTLMRIRAEHIQGETVQLYNVKKDRYYTGFLDAETQQLLKGRKGYVLSWDDPERMPDNNQYQWRMARIFNRLFNEGVTDRRQRVVIHTLRHTVASQLVQNGTPLQVVARVLDHESIRSTERYAKLNQDNVKTALNNIWN